MKCISLWQPWASLMAIGAKRIETRSWPTNHRGPLAIHAAKKWTRELAELCRTDPFRSVLESNNIMRPDDLPMGGVVAVVHLYDCWRVERIERADANITPELDASIAATLRFAGNTEADIQEALKPALTPQERAFGDYSVGRFGWLTESKFLRRLAAPVPCVGHQGIFNLPPDVEAAVMEQITGDKA